MKERYTILYEGIKEGFDFIMKARRGYLRS
jgi:hypothetical protein